MEYFNLAIANEAIKTTDVKGKPYVEVNQRIKAFRMCWPNGSIETEIVSIEDGICVFKASVYDSEHNLLGVGHAYEKEASSFINKTSYIENCETSAVGRALGMCGFGIDISVCSAEELENALQQKDNEKRIAELSKSWSELRSQLEELGCDFRSKKTNAYICKHANVKNQDVRQLNVDELERLCDVYSQMIEKKNEEKE